VQLFGRILLHSFPVTIFPESGTYDNDDDYADVHRWTFLHLCDNARPPSQPLKQVYARVGQFASIPNCNYSIILYTHESGVMVLYGLFKLVQTNIKYKTVYITKGKERKRKERKGI